MRSAHQAEYRRGSVSCGKASQRGHDVKATPPKALDAVVDIVLAYKPKAKSKPARRRKRRATKIAKGK
jgi:hypothetical protein